HHHLAWKPREWAIYRAPSVVDTKFASSNAVMQSARTEAANREGIGRAIFGAKKSFACSDISCLQFPPGAFKARLGVSMSRGPKLTDGLTKERLREDVPARRYGKENWRDLSLWLRGIESFF